MEANVPRLLDFEHRKRIARVPFTEARAAVRYIRGSPAAGTDAVPMPHARPMPLLEAILLFRQGFVTLVHWLTGVNPWDPTVRGSAFVTIAAVR